MAMKKRGGRKGRSTAAFIVSNQRNPSVKLKAGMRLDVQSVKLLSPQLRVAKRLGARLCGGSGTCLALIDVQGGDPAARRAPGR
jgi:hypothetical protein